MQFVAPFISIIIPTHNRPFLLERALESIKSQERSLHYEVIVVSDAVDPANDLVCSKFLGRDDIYVRRNGVPGPAESRNLGISLASGQFIMFLDDDDAWQPGLLSSLAILPERREGKFFYFDCTVTTESRANPRPEIIPGTRVDLVNRLSESVYVKNQVHMSCFAFPRGLIANTRFDPYMRAYEDWDFLLAMFDKQVPVHVSILGTVVFEVADESSDRRGNSRNANDFNAVMDYLYVYRRHPSPNETLRLQRAEMMRQVGMPVPPEVL